MSAPQQRPDPNENVGQVQRLRELATILARHGYGPVLDRVPALRALVPRGVRPADSTEVSRGRRLRELFSDLGPTFVKLGQVLSTRGDLLPSDVVSELSQLQDRVAPVPFSEIQPHLEAALGRPISEAFLSFDPEPLASASIAQVHRATTAGGLDVIVKVQRPGIGARIRADLDLLRRMARVIEAIVDEGLISPTGIVDEFDKAIRSELDFRREAANVLLFRRLHAARDCVRVPAVIPELSGELVLTLERLDGPKVTHFDPARHDRKILAQNLLEISFVGLFEDGAFHGDPHPGNVLALDDNRIGLIDLGLIGRVSRPMRETMVVMVLAIALKDAPTLARLLSKVGVPNQRVNLSQLTSDIQTVLDQYLATSLGDIDAGSMLGDLIDLARNHAIRIPREYAVLGKAAVTIEGVVRRLHPELDVLHMAMPYAQRLLTARLSPTGPDANAQRMLLQLQGIAQDVPNQAAQVLLDLERGQLNVTSRRAETYLSHLVDAVRLLSVSIVSAALIVGALVAQGRSATAPEPWVPWTLWGGVALFAGAFTWFVLGLRLRRIRLKKQRSFDRS